MPWVGDKVFRDSLGHKHSQKPFHRPEYHLNDVQHLHSLYGICYISAG